MVWSLFLFSSYWISGYTQGGHIPIQDYDIHYPSLLTEYLSLAAPSSPNLSTLYSMQLSGQDRSLVMIDSSRVPSSQWEGWGHIQGLWEGQSHNYHRLWSLWPVWLLLATSPGKWGTHKSASSLSQVGCPARENLSNFERLILEGVLKQFTNVYWKIDPDLIFF